MASTEKFCLRWNDFETNISGAFRELREDKDFFDVTLACDDEQLQAHKVILSACSPFFRSILRRNKHEHPLLYLKGVKYVDLVSVLNFMYHGEVNVAQEELNSFLAVAEDLKVKGLTQNNSEPPGKHSKDTRPGSREVGHSMVDKTEHSLPPPAKHPHPAPNPYHHKPAVPASARYQAGTEEVQELLPVVKSEPVHLQQEVLSHPQHPISQTDHQVFPSPQVDQMATAGVVADPNMEYEDDYADYGGYEDIEEGYEGGGLTTMGGQDGSTKDVDILVKSFMKKTTDEFNTTAWQCVQCGKVSKVSTNLKDHIEANHIEGLQFECPQCRKIFKSRPSLRTHMRLHK